MDKETIKDSLKKILPTVLLKTLIKYKHMREWKERHYLEQSPQFIKEEIFLNYGIPNAQWVETGTYKGVTTAFLANLFSHVHSVEPSKDLYESAVKLFKDKNVNLYNDISENIFPSLLTKLNGKINYTYLSWRFNLLCRSSCASAFSSKSAATRRGSARLTT